MINPEKRKIGSWKKNQRKRGFFIRRALSTTMATPKQIAESAGASVITVHDINQRDKIRPHELALQIAVSARLGKPTGKSLKRKKVCLFSNEKKEALLQEHAGVISKVANIW